MAVTERYEAVKRRDVKRMSRAELEQFSMMLHAVARTVDEAIKYERASAKHPAALRYEEQACDQFDAAIIFLAEVRMRDGSN